MERTHIIISFFIIHNKYGRWLEQPDTANGTYCLGQTARVLACCQARIEVVSVCIQGVEYVIANGNWPWHIRWQYTWVKEEEDGCGTIRRSVLGLSKGL